MLNKYLLVYCILLILGCVSLSCKDTDKIIKSSCCEVAHLQAELRGAELFLPNAFSPNFDGINDYFFPHSNSRVATIDEFIIYKKGSGSILWEKSNMISNNPQSGWDGMDTNGKPIEGVFKYLITFTNDLDESATFEGEVCCRNSLPIPCVDSEEHCAFSVQHNGEGGFDSSFDSWENCEE